MKFVTLSGAGVTAALLAAAAPSAAQAAPATATGPDTDVQVHDVSLGETLALARREELVRRGIGEVHVLSVVTNCAV